MKKAIKQQTSKEISQRVFQDSILHALLPNTVANKIFLKSDNMMVGFGNRTI